MERGKYIVIEGGEGCGKSTQAKLLVEYLLSKEIQCVQAREPGSTKEAEQIRALLLNKENNLSSLSELFLFEAARAEFFRNDVIPKLEKGVSIVSDRSGYSTEAYQGYAGGIDLNLIKQLNDLATQGIRPGLSFIIDVNASKGLSREQDADRFAAKGLSYHEMVNRGYKEIAKRNPGSCILLPYVEGNIDGIQKQIRKEVDSRFFSKLI